MKYKVIRTPRANQQLVDIMVYLEQAETGLGLAFRLEAQEVESYLSKFPEMRSVFEHNNPMIGEIRMIQPKKFRHHTFFFRVQKHPEKVVDIIAILHDEQDIDARIDDLSGT